jgi:hypothetical protein
MQDLRSDPLPAEGAISQIDGDIDHGGNGNPLLHNQLAATRNVYILATEPQGVEIGLLHGDFNAGVIRGFFHQLRSFLSFLTFALGCHCSS